MPGTALPTATFTQADSAGPRRRVLKLAGRYSLTAIGPVAVSGAHFAASLIFLHRLSAADFGLFSFLLVVVPFCLSMSSGLLGAPLVSALGKSKTVAEDQFEAFRQVNRLFCLAAGVATALLIWSSHTRLAVSLGLGFYGSAMCLRWFSRFNAFMAGHPKRAAASDLIYSFVLLAGLVVLMKLDRLSLESASAVLAVSAAVSIPAFGWDFLKKQFRFAPRASFAAYWPIWREVTRWSLLGVALSEITANAHAYFVTFVSGPQAFGLLALGSLLMRPVFLVLQALPDRERPVMARAIAAGDIDGARRMVKEMRLAAAAVWLGTVALGAAILIWLPGLLIRKHFDAGSVWIVAAIWAGIVAVRVLRTPEAIFLQAAGEFNALARPAMKSSVASLIAVPVLLVTGGPIASLGGIFVGEFVMGLGIGSLMRKWRAAHG
jgi:hypothetical protein